MKKIYVIINEQHSLMEDQEKCLNELMEGMSNVGMNPVIEEVKVPSDGWSIDQMDKVFNKMLRENEDAMPIEVVFVSPVPYLIMEVASSDYMICRIFHNDKREKKELPNGKIVYTVAKEGWQLV